ncbi:FkbM family methyltransferase [Methanocorpusculum sp. MG]|uniref:FkbM family methyltransferase n=1 Tax=Methanocorpusculum petauri TaxID=3002863 RepID=A0ABT4IES9_9EURY|nr:FkbM family methyltransferase [Methanocorpusculum petauri]
MNHNMMAIGRKIVPLRFYPTIRRILHKKELHLLRSSYSHSNDPEISEIMLYLDKHGFVSPPYVWADMTNSEVREKFSKVDVYNDADLNLHYTLLEGKRIYFPRNWGVNYIRQYYFGLQEIEQHPQSPHRYLTDEFSVDENSIVVDCGVAEGNFGLSIVEKCKKLYLFEPEERWMEPLKATFAPWKDKVVIVQKYLSDTTDEINTTLDDYFSDKEYPNFLKLDVEGYEERLLLGTKKILSSNDLKKVVACIYHKAEDEEIVGALLREHGFTTIPSLRYMIVFFEGRPPYLRRGVLRATKIQ